MFVTEKDWIERPITMLRQPGRAAPASKTARAAAASVKRELEDR
ncbi:MAG: hypothetical protein AAF160_09585 [Pseudomonadota bacterium]